MKEDLSLSLARKMQKLLRGEKLAYSSFPPMLAQELLNEEIVISISHGSKRSFQLRDRQGLCIYLAQRYDMDGDLERWIAIRSGKQTVSRSEQVQTIKNSKLGKTRTFRGFLINCIEPIEASLRNLPYLLQPMKGISIFMEDYEHFRIPEDIVVIGIENGENFQSLTAQRDLFGSMKVLFVSRYPQSKDLRSWLQQIPNRYIHFGDFDLAGISIHLTEFYPYLGDRAEFFIPPDIEQRLQKGNRSLYDKQYTRYEQMKIADKRLQPLVDMIHRYRRVYEQEGYIEKTA